MENLKEYTFYKFCWNDFKKCTIKIPENLKFFVCTYIDGKTKDIGEMCHVDAEHICSIIKKNAVDISTFKIYNYVDIVEFGDYYILTIECVRIKDNPFLMCKREDIFKDEDLNKYVIASYDEFGRLKNVSRIINFYSPWTVITNSISKRNIISTEECLNISAKIKMHLHTLIHQYNSEIKIISDKEAEILWNSVIYDIIKNIQYDINKVNKQYNFDN